MPRCAAAERQQQVENHRRIVEPVAVQVADLTHAVAHGLRVHVQLGGHGITAALVKQPGPQRLLESLAGGRPEGGQRGERPGPQVIEGFRVSADAVEYLVEARDKGGSIVARDTSLATLRVL